MLRAPQPPIDAVVLLKLDLKQSNYVLLPILMTLIEMVYMRFQRVLEQLKQDMLAINGDVQDKSQLRMDLKLY